MCSPPFCVLLADHPFPSTTWHLQRCSLDFSHTCINTFLCHFWPICCCMTPSERGSMAWVAQFYNLRVSFHPWRKKGLRNMHFFHFVFISKLCSFYRWLNAKDISSCKVLVFHLVLDEFFRDCTCHSNDYPCQILKRWAIINKKPCETETKLNAVASQKLFI